MYGFFGSRCKVPSCDGPDASFSAAWLQPPGADSLRGDAPVKQCRAPVLDACARLNLSTDQPCTEWLYEKPDSFVAEVSSFAKAI